MSWRLMKQLMPWSQILAHLAACGGTREAPWSMAYRSRGCPPPRRRRDASMAYTRRGAGSGALSRSAPARWREKQSFGHRRRFSAAPLLRRWLCAVEVQQSAVPTTNDQVVDAVAVEIGQTGRRGLVHS